MAVPRRGRVSGSVPDLHAVGGALGEEVAGFQRRRLAGNGAQPRELRSLQHMRPVDQDPALEQHRGDAAAAGGHVHDVEAPDFEVEQEAAYQHQQAALPQQQVDFGAQLTGVLVQQMSTLMKGMFVEITRDQQVVAAISPAPSPVVVDHTRGRRAPERSSDGVRPVVINPARGRNRSSHAASRPGHADSMSEESTGENHSRTSTRASRRSSGAGHGREGPRLPAFMGKESWKVWLNRFEDVAEQRGWTDADKLNELLPKLQGVAGEFVYGQLSRRIRRSYQELIQELNNRFRKVESTKAFGAQFSCRQQKAGETVEEYAAELKRLYDKAHPHRDNVTRCEDLLRRFLDGLMDDRARMQVEYVKDPPDIDCAVFEVVNYLETCKRAQTETRSRVAHGSLRQKPD